MSEGCPLCERVAAARAGRDPLAIAEFGETVVVLGENQGCRGWCVLILKEHCEHLAELSVERQQRVFAEVARVAGAIRAVFAGSGPPRINYECLGNVVAHVHWHVIPRHGDDPEPRRPVWGWEDSRLRGEMGEGERRALVGRLRGELRSGSGGEERAEKRD